MGFEDRSYYREGPRFGFGGGGFGGPSMVNWLLGINVVVFLVDMVLGGATRTGGVTLSGLGAFSVAEAVYGFQVWRFVTYQFLHAGFFHLLFNMIGLFFFGRFIEDWLGSKRFLAFYLLCGVSGAVLFTLLSLVPGLIPGAGGPLVGASGAVFGILAAGAVVAPNMKVLLMFIFPVKLRTLCVAFLAIGALSVIVGGRNAGGEAAHLGGAGLGFLLIMKPGWLNWADGWSTPDVRGAVASRKREKAAKREAATEAEVDRILAKVRDHGLQSLTNKEKKTLAEATERQRRAG